MNEQLLVNLYKQRGHDKETTIKVVSFVKELEKYISHQNKKLNDINV